MLLVEESHECLVLCPRRERCLPRRHELRDALDVGDMESAVTLSGLISRGAAKMASLVHPSNVANMVP